MSSVSHVVVSKNATNLEMMTPGNWTDEQNIFLYSISWKKHRGLLSPVNIINVKHTHALFERLISLPNTVFYFQIILVQFAESGR